MTGEISQRSHNVRQQIEGQSANINSLFIYYNLNLLQPVTLARTNDRIYYLRKSLSTEISISV